MGKQGLEEVAYSEKWFDDESYTGARPRGFSSIDTYVSFHSNAFLYAQVELFTEG